ncbi:hypothetical protein G7054_g14481 [Neopestalotiopsis clavispora]|nr:hypothetical protein G7054_g14481 [Neopestalotiopsis clavispora]
MYSNILITGASGYLGGSLLTQVCRSSLPSDAKVFALVRSSSQQDAVRQLGAEPLTFDAYDQLSVRKAIMENDISIIFYLIDCNKSDSAICFIKALGDLQRQCGKKTHFIFTTGTKQFGQHAGAPTDSPLLDTTPDLYEIQKHQKSPYTWAQGAVAANCEVIEEGGKHGVCTYMFSPCMVYGKGQGFGNRISIQVVDIVKAALAARRVYNPNPKEDELWPVCHIDDTTSLYVELLQAIIKDQSPAHGKNGYYLASSGLIAWADVYSAFANALAKHGVVEDAKVLRPDRGALERMADALGCEPDFVPVWIGGHCVYTAKHGQEIGWFPQYPADHLLQVAEEEAEFILDQLKK